MKNKGYLLALVLLVGVAGCGKKNKKATNKAVSSHVDIPTADEGIRTFFDEEIGEFALADEKNNDDVARDTDFAFEDNDQKQFKAVYFAFDDYNIKKDQETTVAYDLDKIKESLKEVSKKGEQPLVIVEGHACHSAGSAVYNLALSEKRAKVLSDKLVAQGIQKENIKIVGRGQEMPAMINGKTVTGDRNAQWPNRRDEIRVMAS